MEDRWDFSFVLKHVKEPYFTKVFLSYCRDLCHEAWTNLRLSPMFGCICPNNHMKRRCDKIFSVVNHNPCVGKSPNAIFYCVTLDIYPSADQLLCRESLPIIFSDKYSHELLRVNSYWRGLAHIFAQLFRDEFTRFVNSLHSWVCKIIKINFRFD